MINAGGCGGLAVEDSQRSITYRALGGAVGAVTQLLAEGGVRPGDRVAVAVRNSAASVEIFLACAAIGAVWVGVNPSAPAAQQRRQLGMVTPQAFIAETGAETPAGTVFVDAGPLLSGKLDPQTPRWHPPSPDAPCAIAFTSGTTGSPKALVHSRAGLSLAAASLATATLRPTDRVGVTLPLSIHNVMIVGPLAALAAGATAVVLDRLNAREVASACRSRALTMVRALVPATVYDLVHDNGIAGGSLSTLREAGVGAAGLSETLRAAFEEKFGVRLVGSYGLSEAPAAVCHEDIGRPRSPGSSGTPLPHVSMSVRDGELWIGPATDGPWANQYRPALGTWAGGRLLRREQHENCFGTGDIGWIDDAGAVHITARKGDVIIRGGVNVTATELATVLGEIPGVREAAVIGKADPRLGERIVAFVETEPDAMLDIDSLRHHAETLLSHPKVPDVFVIVDALPRNAMGKVARGELQE